MNDIFGNDIIDKPVHINIYADEIQGKKCPITNDYWDYIGIIIEDLDYSLLNDIINERFIYNLDKNSTYYEKNNKLVHWCEIRNADDKNICKRWFQYIMDLSKSNKKFYSYILGINHYNLIIEEFDKENEFNSIYNRFFRSALKYPLKTFFNNRKIIVENVFHEVGQQQYYKYFPWYTIYKLEQELNIEFKNKEIIFLPKDHRVDFRSNLIQLCDCILEASTTLIHGIEKSSKSNYRE